MIRGRIRRRLLKNVASNHQKSRRHLKTYRNVKCLKLFSDLYKCNYRSRMWSDISKVGIGFLQKLNRTLWQLRNNFENLTPVPRLLDCTEVVEKKEKIQRKIKSLDTAITLYIQEGSLHPKTFVTIPVSAPGCTTAYSQGSNQWNFCRGFLQGFSVRTFFENNIVHHFRKQYFFRLINLKS